MRDLSVTDVAVIAALGLGLYLWLRKNNPGFSIGLDLLTGGQAGDGGPLTPADLDRVLNFYDVSPAGVRTFGTMSLRNAGGLIASPPANGWRMVPADPEAQRYVQRYLAQRAAGALPA